MKNTHRAQPTLRLMPPEAFSDDKSVLDPQFEREMRAFVACTFASRTCGMRTPPTEAEFYAALEAETPDAQQLRALNVWLCEADNHRIVRGLHAGLYSMRALIRAMHALSAPEAYPDELIRILNHRSTPEWYQHIAEFDPVPEPMGDPGRWNG